MKRLLVAGLLMGCLCFGGAPVLDPADLPIDVSGLVEDIEQLKTSIDQVRQQIEQFDHWRRQAQKMARRAEFQLKELKSLNLETAVSRFYTGNRMARLAVALDGKGLLDEFLGTYQDAFPKMRQVPDMDFGAFSISRNLYKRFIQPKERAYGLAELGVVNALGNVSESRSKLKADNRTRDKLFLEWTQPQAGEQEALDHIAAQLYHQSQLEQQALLNLTASVHTETTDFLKDYQEKRIESELREARIQAATELEGRVTPPNRQAWRLP